MNTNRRTFLTTAGAGLAALAATRLTDRARQLHQESVIINCHDHMRRRDDYLDMVRGGVTAKIFKPLADGVYWDEQNRRVFPRGEFDWTQKYLQLIEQVEAFEKAGDPPVLIVRRVDDLSRAKATHKAGVILGNEGTLPLGGSLEMLERLYRRGLRELALFWPGHTRTGHAVIRDGSLTDFSHQVVEKCNELGIIVDTSHLAHAKAFKQVLEESKAPVIHTHGAPKYPRSVRFREGDLEDDQIRAIARSNGVIGLHSCTYIQNLARSNRPPTLDDLVEHVQHLVKTGGIDCVAIGPDHFPYNHNPIGNPFGETESALIEDRDWSGTFVVGMEKISGLPLFTQALVDRGFSDEEIRKILGLNALRVLKEVWKE